MKISLPDALAKITHWVQLTFSESNRLIVSVICAWLSIKAISITTKQSKTRATWSRTTEPQAAHRIRPSARGRLWSDWKMRLKKRPEMLNLAHAWTFCRGVELIRPPERSEACLVPRRLSFDENLRAKEGGKETRLPSVPFPWSLAVHHQSLVSRLPLPCEKRSAWGGGWLEA